MVITNLFKSTSATLCKILFFLLVFFLSGTECFSQVDLSQSKIICLETKDKVVKKSVQVLQQEIQKRTSLLLPVQNKWPKDSRNIIFVGQESDLKKLPQKYAETIQRMPAIAKDGYKIYTDGNTVIVLGADPRGTLFGVGKLLRTLELRNKNILLTGSLQISSTPKYPIRGHQLGYRPKTNAYDAWTPEIYDAYIRDLAIFGANSIEIMPPVTDDDLTSVNMKLPAMDMDMKISAICDSYGLDVWVWYPLLIGRDFESAEGVAKELKEWDEFFQKMPRIDAIFVPAGDPGRHDPNVVFPFLEKATQALHRYHPNAKMWVSPQGTYPKRLEDFYKLVNAKPDWLDGVVYGPWIRETIAEVRDRVRSDIPIRRYPDITHNIRCQYPIYDFDVAWSVTLGREFFNPRPVDHKIIHNAFDRFAVGSISYSEGINDDVNKFIWIGQDWNPETPVVETLRDYSRLFIGPDYTDDFTSALFSLERNLRGPIAANNSIEATLDQFRDMKKKASNSLLSNYRFQLALIRAYYDAYIYRRYYHEKEHELQARVVLSSAAASGSLSTLAKAKEILLQCSDTNIMSDIREKCMALADSLYRSIGAQLTIERHHGMEDRGNFIDHIDTPVTDAVWLISNINRIEKLSDEATRLEEIKKMLGRTNPGPGGVYDNFGSSVIVGKVQRNIPWEKDPGNLRSPVIEFGLGVKDYRWPKEIKSGDYQPEVPPIAWMNQLTALYTHPLVVTYDNLDANSNYKIRVTYNGWSYALVKLYINDVLIHDFIRSGISPTHEFPIPPEVMKDGRLELKWIAHETDRATHVAELWIIKE